MAIAFLKRGQMQDPYNFIQECTGFQWDKGNLLKNWEKHGVSSMECEQLFFNRPLLAFPDSKHSALENRYYVLGQTDEGRHLFLVFTVRDSKIRVISARNMSRKEKLVYAKA